MKEVKYVVVLTAISLVCAALLGAVYQVTAEPIQQAKDRAVVEGIAKVLPDGCTTDMGRMLAVDSTDPVAPVIYPTVRDGVVVGAAVKATSPAGYGGNVVVMVGLEGLPDGEIKVFSTSVLDMSKETPGLGSKIAEPAFADQFIGKAATAEPFAVQKDKGDVHAISGATISSRAFTGCVNAAVKAWKENGAKIVAGGTNG